MQILLKLLGASLIIISLSVSITVNINFYNEIAKLNSQTEDLRVDLASNFRLNEELKKQVENRDLQIDNLTLKVNLLNSSSLRLKNKNLNLTKQLIKDNGNLNELTGKFESLKGKIGLINPTYKQLEDFVRKDKTDEKEWAYKYDCTEFSNEFISNFANEGYFSCSTEIDYTKSPGGKRFGHIIVAINTTDKGLIYLEPQTDNLINPVFMKKNYNYCSAVDWDCKWNMKKISSCFELIV